MTSATTPRSQRRRSSSGTTTTTAAGTSRATRIARGVLTGIWLIGVPLLVARYVDQQVGTKLGVVPAFWLGGDPLPAGPNVAGLLALVLALALAATLHHLRAVFTLVVIPVAAMWIGSVMFGPGPGSWAAFAIGLVVGGIAFTSRRKQGR